MAGPTDDRYGPDHARNALTWSARVEHALSDDLSAELDDPGTRRERITPLCRWFGLPSLISCSYGHRHIWEDIRRSGARSALILEDDALFAEDYTNERFAGIWQQVPADWQMVYLGHYDVREIGRMLRRKAGSRRSESRAALLPHVGACLLQSRAIRQVGSSASCRAFGGMWTTRWRWT